MQHRLGLGGYFCKNKKKSFFPQVESKYQDKCTYFINYLNSRCLIFMISNIHLADNLVIHHSIDI